REIDRFTTKARRTQRLCRRNHLLAPSEIGLSPRRQPGPIFQRPEGFRRGDKQGNKTVEYPRTAGPLDRRGGCRYRPGPLGTGGEIHRGGWMNSFELNKVIGAVLLGGFVLLLSSIIAGKLVVPHKSESHAMVAPTGESGGQAAAPAAEEKLESVIPLLATAD